MGSYRNWQLSIEPIGGLGSGVIINDWITDLDIIETMSGIGEASFTLDLPASCCAELGEIDPGWHQWVLVVDGCEVARGMITVGPAGSGLLEFGGRGMLEALRLSSPSVAASTAGGNAVEFVAGVLSSAGLSVQMVDTSLAPLITASVSPSAEGSTWKQLANVIGVSVEVVAIGKQIFVFPVGTCSLGWISGDGWLNSSMFASSSDDGEPLTLGRRMDRWATTVTVIGAGGITAKAGGPVSTQGQQLGVHRVVKSESADPQALAELAKLLVSTSGQRAPLVLVADAEGSWLECESGITACGLRPGACVNLEATTCGGGSVSEKAWIRAVRWRWSESNDDHEIRAGLVVAQSGASWADN